MNALKKIQNAALATIRSSAIAKGLARELVKLGSSQQPNITALSVPAGPRNDAAFVSATTAPPTFVFRPGAVFPNNGPVKGNVYTTGNSSGTDGLVLLQAVLAGSGLSPASPLPSCVVEIDLSQVGGSYSFTAATFTLPKNTVLRGIPDSTTNSPPTVTFTLTGQLPVCPVEIDGLSITVGPSVAGAVCTVSGSGCKLLIHASGAQQGISFENDGATGSAFLSIVDGGELDLTLNGEASISVNSGDSSNPFFAIDGASSWSFLGLGQLNFQQDTISALSSPSNFNLSGLASVQTNAISGDQELDVGIWSTGCFFGIPQGASPIFIDYASVTANLSATPVDVSGSAAVLANPNGLVRCDISTDDVPITLPPIVGLVDGYIVDVRITAVEDYPALSANAVTITADGTGTEVIQNPSTGEYLAFGSTWSSAPPTGPGSSQGLMIRFMLNLQLSPPAWESSVL